MPTKIDIPPTHLLIYMNRTMVNPLLLSRRIRGGRPIRILIERALRDSGVIGCCEQELTDREWVQAAFDQLTEEEKYIVNSFLFGGFKGKEIAESLGIGDSTLRSKYRRALQKMKKYLES